MSQHTKTDDLTRHAKGEIDKLEDLVLGMFRQIGELRVAWEVETMAAGADGGDELERRGAADRMVTPLQALAAGANGVAAATGALENLRQDFAIVPPRSTARRHFARATQHLQSEPPPRERGRR